MQFPYPNVFTQTPRLGAFQLGPNHSHELGIYTGDCVQLMKRLPDNSINIILTSPPYNVGLKYDGYEDKLSDREHKQFTAEWLKEAYRVTVDTGRLYAIVSDRMLWWFKGKAEKAGWSWGQLLTWCKPNFAGSTQRISGDWNIMSEYILLFRKGSRTSMLNGQGSNTHNWFVETVPQSNFSSGRIHPAQLPLSLCRKILSRTPGEVVLDPFAGSGSVCLAARGLERQYLGFELVPSVARGARARLQTRPLFLPPQQDRMELDGAA
jgi:DNA modification methylase